MVDRSLRRGLDRRVRSGRRPLAENGNSAPRHAESGLIERHTSARRAYSHREEQLAIHNREDGAESSHERRHERQREIHRGYTASRHETCFPGSSNPRLSQHLVLRHGTARIARTWVAAFVAGFIAHLRWQRRGSSVLLEDKILLDGDLRVSGIRSSVPSVEIFTAPKPYVGDDAKRQLRALETWLALEPRPVVTILGSPEGTESVVRKYGVNWVADVDASFLGVPLFSSIFHVANSSTADIAVITNADVLIFDDFYYTIRKVDRDLSTPWMVAGARWDVVELPRGILEPRGPNERLLESHRLEAVRYARENGTLHTYGGIDLWAWNVFPTVPLFDGIMPQFVFGRGKYDNWLTHEVIAAKRRTVIDVSEACTLVHISHDHHLVEQPVGQDTRRSKDGDPISNRAFWSQSPRVKFELYINTYLAASHGTYTNQMGTVLHAPKKLTSCYESEGLCLFNRRRPHVCRCEHSPFVLQAQTDPFAVNDSRIIFCGLESSETKEQRSGEDGTLYRFVVSGREQAYSTSSYASHHQDQISSRRTGARSILHGALLELEQSEPRAVSTSSGGTTFGLPLTLDRLLEFLEHRTGTTETVLTVLNSRSIILLPRFACAAKRAGVFDKMLVAALDDETYRYAVTRGYAVYLEESIYEHESEMKLATLQYATDDESGIFHAVLARVTRRLTSLGRKVFCADPNVILRRDPFPHWPDDADIALMGLPVPVASKTLDGREHGLTQGSSLSASQRELLRANRKTMSPCIIFARPSTTANLVLDLLSDVNIYSKEHGAPRGLPERSYSILDEQAFRVMYNHTWSASNSDQVVAVYISAGSNAEAKARSIDSVAEFAAYDAVLQICRLSVRARRRRA